MRSTSLFVVALGCPAPPIPAGTVDPHPVAVRRERLARMRQHASRGARR